MNALDLFCGAGGGWSLGLHRAGFRTVAACEIDPWRRAVFGRNFPDARLYDDIRSLTAARLRADGAGDIDIVCGSPPCQDASTANAKGRGIDGDRTGLFFEFIRLVGELRPRWVAAENVPGLRVRGVDRVLAALEREGYAVWPLVVGARHVGAPHKRDRVWIVAYRYGGGREGQAVPAGSRAAGSRAPDAGRGGEGLGPDLAPVLGPALAGRQSDRAGAGAAADAASRRRERPDGTDEAGRSRRQSQGRASRHAHVERLAVGQGQRSDPRQELPPALRAIGEAWPRWNGGAGGIGRVDDGLPRGMARPALAAYGDAILPQIAEAIGRAILAVDAQQRAAA